MLTDAKIRTTRAGEKPIKLTDSNGLYLRITPDGARAWRYRFKIDGRESTFSIGPYPQVSLQEARRLRDDARALVRQGTNPAHARQEDRLTTARTNAITFASVAEEWMRSKSIKATPYYMGQIRRAMDADIFPAIGKLPVGTITSARVMELLRAVDARGAPTVAINIRQWVSQVYSLAISTGRAESDPTVPLRRMIDRPNTNHARPLSRDELATLWRRLDAYGGNRTTVLAIKMLAYTFVRTAELRAAPWSEFDLDRALWTIPAERMKKRRAHIVPLSRQVLAILAELREITGAGVYLFPNSRRPRTPMSGTTINRALEYMGYASGDTSGHDFRATANTHLLEAGFDERHTEMQLAHAPKSKTAAAYNHAQFLPARVEMMQAWADWLDGVAR